MNLVVILILQIFVLFTMGLNIHHSSPHFSVWLVCCRGLPTDRYMWSDASGLHECTKTNTKPPSLQWTWVSTAVLENRWGSRCCKERFGRSLPSLGCSQVSDWAVDYSVSGGTDKEGWQYAADFPACVSSVISLIYLVLSFYYSPVFRLLSSTSLSPQVIPQLQNNEGLCAA